MSWRSRKSVWGSRKVDQTQRRTSLTQYICEPIFAKISIFSSKNGPGNDLICPGNVPGGPGNVSQSPGVITGIQVNVTVAFRATKYALYIVIRISPIQISWHYRKKKPFPAHVSWRPRKREILVQVAIQQISSWVKDPSLQDGWFGNGDSPSEA